METSLWATSEPTCPQAQEASRCRCEPPEGKHLPWRNIVARPSLFGTSTYKILRKKRGAAPGIAEAERYSN